MNKKYLIRYHIEEITRFNSIKEYTSQRCKEEFICEIPAKIYEAASLRLFIEQFMPPFSKVIGNVIFGGENHIAETFFIDCSTGKKYKIEYSVFCSKEYRPIFYSTITIKYDDILKY